MKFNSTRNTSVEVSASVAIAEGIAKDGGLYVPKEFPRLPKDFVETLSPLDYEMRAAKIVGAYLTDYGEEELLSACKSAYARFDGEPAPLVKTDEGVYLLELWHGPTCAFKDVALCLLPHLMTAAKKKQGITEDIRILTATSGDTGKAALEGFRDVSGTSVTVFYPSDGVSDVQKLQMTTQEGNNVCVCGVRGNFDDCQSAVKKAFSSEKVISSLRKKKVRLSSANSINFGRLVPQIVYYISAYVDLVASGELKEGDKINFCVPTGNFGNILAGFYAKQMGLPIAKLICASNSNKVLTDFFQSGEYSLQRDFLKTISPSMDILISSNLERLTFELSGRDGALTQRRMQELKSSGKYRVTAQEKAAYDAHFHADFATEEETYREISEFFEAYGYVLDPHTAVAASVYRKYRERSKDRVKTVIVSTASPYKFADSVYEAISGEKCGDAFDAIAKLYEESAIEIPESLSALKQKTVRFRQVIGTDEIENFVLGEF